MNDKKVCSKNKENNNRNCTLSCLWMFSISPPLCRYFNKSDLNGVSPWIFCAHKIIGQNDIKPQKSLDSVLFYSKKKVFSIEFIRDICLWRFWVMISKLSNKYSKTNIFCSFQSQKTLNYINRSIIHSLFHLMSFCRMLQPPRMILNS